MFDGPYMSHFYPFCRFYFWGQLRVAPHLTTVKMISSPLQLFIILRGFFFSSSLVYSNEVIPKSTCDASKTVTMRYASTTKRVHLESSNETRGGCSIPTRTWETLGARAFIGEPSYNKLTVDHIDRDKKNNNISNLRWAFPSEQSMDTKLKREHKTGGVREVIKCHFNGSQIHVFSSLKEAAQSVNSKIKNPASNISGALNGRTNTAVGCKWVYSDDERIDGEVWGNVDTTCRHDNATGHMVLTEGRLRDPKGVIRLPLKTPSG